ncbi:MFS transporter [Streptomyces sp. CA-249302]|uniref:MFS transporter n=1 Tax=Streptomyces sp. CA-249302 TaxID=3240058 RepID=UPI003D9451B1
MTHSQDATLDAAPPTTPAPHAASYRLGPLYLMIPLVGAVLTMVWVGIGSFLIPMQVAAIKGGNDPDALKNAVAVGAAIAAISNPVFGQIADRTRSRYGRRAPWMLICTLLGAGALLWQANVKSIALLAVTWGSVQFLLSGFQSAFTAVMPDRVPPAKYALMSGLSGLAIPIGTIGAAFVIGGIDGHKFGYDGVLGGFGGTFQGANGYYLIAAVLLVAVLLFCVVAPEKSSKGMTVEPFDLGRFASNFWVDPRRHPDFALAFISRFGVITGYFMIQMYSFYILMEYIRVAPQEAASTMGFLMVISALATVVAAVGVGKLADRFDRIKPFVLVSGILGALSLVIPMLWASVNGMIAFNIVNGIAFGAYLAVDLALITRVLPRGADAGKDMGLLNIANAAPQVAAPFLAAAIVSAWGYNALFPICGGVALSGAVAVAFVKSVR